MQKKYKVLLIIIVILLLLVSGVTIYMSFFRPQASEATNTSNVVNKIDSYAYTLDDRDSELMEKEFENLKKVLDEEDINYQEYAKSLSKLFVIDLYTIDNKINKYDIGSAEYLLESEKEKFKNILLDSIYANVEDNSNHSREQDLPVVESIEVTNIKEETYNLGEKAVDSFAVELAWTYKEDMGYDTKAIVTLIKDENKLCVVEYSPIIEDVKDEDL